MVINKEEVLLTLEWRCSVLMQSIMKQFASSCRKYDGYLAFSLN